MENYQKLKQIIYKANPKIRIRIPQCPKGKCGICDYSRKNPQTQYRTIRLADVLLAYAKKQKDRGEMKRREDWVDINNLWDFKDDNLDHQSDETKKFLEDLLIAKSQK